MNDDITDRPLVSVIVITYNSSEFILETLESVKLQSYLNIELIISDDCSKDHTLALCERWLTENQSRFTETHLVRGLSNSGIAPNINRGLLFAKGEWTKIVDGDDLLEVECIETMVSFTKANDARNFYFCDVQQFTNAKNLSLLKINILLEKISLRWQYKFLLLRVNPPPSPGFFAKTEVIKINQGFDEVLPYLEDAPKWIELSGLGYRIVRIPFIGARYRVHESNVTNRESPMHIKLKECRVLLRKRIISLLLKEHWYFSCFFYAWHQWLWEKSILSMPIKNSKLFRYLFCLVFDPIFIFSRILEFVNNIAIISPEEKR